jgi:Domain of unknown function (DUF4439)
MSRLDDTGDGVVAGLQAVLSAENVAVYGYGLVGAQLSGGQLAVAQQDWNDHRAACANLTAMITGMGAKAAPPAAAYRPPFPVNSARAAVSLAAMLEDGVVTAYLSLVAVDDPSMRAFGAQGMQTAAVRAAYWQGSTTAFPGMPASALRR